MDEWLLQAPPAQGLKHWVDGRSAKEMAREYLSQRAATRLKDLLYPVFGRVVLSPAETECSISFDCFSGPRQCDLSLQAQVGKNLLVIHIEGKADEPFGELTGKVYDHATAGNARRFPGRKSRVPDRIELLAKRLFDTGVTGQIRDLRYQLLFASAAALSDAIARDASAAVIIVHEFRSAKTRSVLLNENASDWMDFLQSFPELQGTLCPGETLLGPVLSPCAADRKMPLYFAKLVTQVSDAREATA